MAPAIAMVSRTVQILHECASLMLATGVDARMIAETLAHSRVSTRVDTFSYLILKLQPQVADRVDERSET